MMEMDKKAAIRLWNETVQKCVGVAGDPSDVTEEVLLLTPLGGVALAYGLKPWLSDFVSKDDHSHSTAAKLLRDWANAIDPPTEDHEV